MAIEVVDALMVTLGLDSSGYKKGRQEVSDEQKKQREDAAKTAKYMEEQGKKASSFFSSIKNELLALAGVTLSVSGLTTFVKSTTSGLMDLSIQSQALGMSAKSLEGWGRAAEAAGSSAEKIKSVLGGFQGAIQGARIGDYSSPLFRSFAQLHALTGDSFDVWSQDSAGLARSTLDSLRKISDPNLRRQMAQQFGYDDATIQANQAGKFLPAVDRYTSSSGATQQNIDNAKKFNEQWTDLSQNLQNTGYIVFNALTPYIKEFNDYLLKLSVWVTEHPKEIHDAIHSVFDGISNAATEANKLATEVGGWKNVAEGLIALKLAGWLWGVFRGAKGLFGLPVPAWLIALAGIDASKRISSLHEEAQKEGKSIGDVLIQKMQDKQADNDVNSWGARLINWLSPGNGLGNPWQYAPDGSGMAPKPTAASTAMLGWMSSQFTRLETKYGLPAGLLNSVATTESGGNQFAINKKSGAKGMFQFMDETANDLGLRGDDVFDPSKSAEAAARYLRYLLNSTGGDMEKALAEWNWGIGNVQRNGMNNLPGETRQFVPRVMAGMRPGSGMAVDRTVPGQANGAPQYYFYGTQVTTPAQTVDKLATDIQKHGENRVLLMPSYSGQ